jgi:hypothetical protein
MCSLTYPEKKKSSGLKMGDLGGQGIDPAHLLTLVIKEQ